MATDILRRGDVAVGLILLAFGAGASVLALMIPPGPLQRTLPPNTVPLICTVGIALCGLGLTIRGFIVTEQLRLRVPFDGRQALVFTLFAAFFLAFEHADYRLLLALFIPSVMFTLGCRSWRQLVIVTLAAIVGIWIFFVELFNVFLPTWT